MHGHKARPSLPHPLRGFTTLAGLPESLRAHRMHPRRRRSPTGAKSWSRPFGRGAGAGLRTQTVRGLYHPGARSLPCGGSRGTIARMAKPAITWIVRYVEDGVFKVRTFQPRMRRRASCSACSRPASRCAAGRRSERTSASCRRRGARGRSRAGTPIAPQRHGGGRGGVA